jgi:hypothetical protein
VKARQRLLEICGYDYAAEANYRHVIDTDDLSAGQIVELISGLGRTSLGA